VLNSSNRLTGGITISLQDGGSLSTPGQEVTITFYSDGLPEPIVAIIQEDETMLLPNNFALMGPKVQIQAQWQSNYQPVNKLDPEAQPILNPNAKPSPPQSRYWASISMQLEAGQEKNDMLAIARLAQDGGKWEILPTRIDAQTGVALAETDRLGVFALIENVALWFTNRQTTTALSVQCNVVAVNDECIVDDLDPEFRHNPARQPPPGRWDPADCGPGSCLYNHAFWTYNRSTYEPAPLNEPWDGGIWTPPLPLAGYYYVQAWIPGDHATTRGADYEIHHAGQVDTVTVNQGAISGDWKPLGAYQFAADGSEFVSLDDVVPEQDVPETGDWAYIGFDAVRFIYAGLTPPPPVDLIPPVIHEVRRWFSNGRTNIRAHVTDNVAVDRVELVFNGARTRMNAIGGDWYEAIVSVPLLQDNQYQIIAVDTSGNVATFPRNARLKVRGYPSEYLGSYNSACNGPYLCDPGSHGNEADPVNTAYGNFFYDTTDLPVAGIGDTDIMIGRMFNGLPNEPQGVISYTADSSGNISESPFYVHPEPFGPGWTLSTSPSLLVMDNGLLHGVQVRYPDGHTVNFAEAGGAFNAVETRVYDTLTAQAGGYRLKLKDLTEYQFDSSGRLTGLSDRNGNTLTYIYTGDRLTRIENSAGRWVNLEYNDEGFIRDIYAPENIHLQYRYIDGLLTTFIDANGNPWGYEYEGGRLSAITTPKGHPSLRLTYDELGRVKEQIIGATEHYTFTYDHDARTTAITDAYGSERVHVYDDKYRLIESRDAHGQSEFYDYDDADHRNSFKDREGREWHYTSDEHGNRLTEDGPLGWHREWAYNSLNLLTHMTETVSISPTVIRVFTFDYDPRGNLIEICNPIPPDSPDCSSITYDPRGLPTHIYDFARNHTLNGYDSEGDLVSITNAMTETVDLDHDGLGRVISVELPLRATHTYTFTYDGNDNLTDIYGPLGFHQGYRYDGNNNLEIEIDPNGGQIRYGYDASDNLITTTNQLTFTAVYTYGLMNELQAFEDAEGRVWNYDLDKLFRTTDSHGPLDTHTHFDYDTVGNITRRVDAEGRATRIEYDALNRPVTTTLNYRPGEPESADVNVTTVYSYNLVLNGI